MTRRRYSLLLATGVLCFSLTNALQFYSQKNPLKSKTRRSWMFQAGQGLATATATTASVVGILLPQEPVCAAYSPSSSPPPDLIFVETPSGIKYADAKIGTGPPITQKGTPITIDYVMSTTGARYGAKIYSTIDRNEPYRWQLGDGTTIVGLEMAIVGGSDIEPMKPGGIRRVIIPSQLAYASLAQPLPGLQYQDCQEGRGVGPIPPAGEGNAAEYYQRFKNIYCNANRPYQPDLVMDIKLYGKR